MEPVATADLHSRRHCGTNLYVGGLPQSVLDANLRALFAPFGDIVSAKVMLNIHSGKSRGIGFVKFADPSSCDAAISGMHRAEVDGEKIVVRFADAQAEYTPPRDKTTKVFVRNIPLDVRPATLRDFFARYGQVKQMTLHLDTAGFKDGGSGVRCRIAYVNYTSVEEAERACDSIHGLCPFASGHAALMAKLAESHSRRHERLAAQKTKFVKPTSGSEDLASDDGAHQASATARTTDQTQSTARSDTSSAASHGGSYDLTPPTASVAPPTLLPPHSSIFGTSHFPGAMPFVPGLAPAPMFSTSPSAPAIISAFPPSYCYPTWAMPSLPWTTAALPSPLPGQGLSPISYPAFSCGFQPAGMTGFASAPAPLVEKSAA